MLFLLSAQGWVFGRRPTAAPRTDLQLCSLNLAFVYIGFGMVCKYLARPLQVRNGIALPAC